MDQNAIQDPLSIRFNAYLALQLIQLINMINNWDKSVREGVSFRDPLVIKQAGYPSFLYLREPRCYSIIPDPGLFISF